MKQQVYVPAKGTDLFGWFHFRADRTKRDCAVVVCNPFGFEYTHSHRSVRHLADRLAEQGFPTLRFDYHGTGDSPGDELDPDRLPTWISNIEAAIAFVRATTECKKICVVGIRLGAALAARVSAQTKLDFLILWNPVVRGSRYLRELQAIAATSGLSNESPDASIEVAGFPMSKDTAAQIKEINLLEERIQAERVLLIHRDDLDKDTALEEKLKQDQVPADSVCLPGYLDMMAEPHFTKVPEAVLGATVKWLLSQTEALADSLQPFDGRTETALNAGLREKSIRFGESDKLFGILTVDGKPDVEQPVLVLMNAGSVHHVGPNRIYVALARKLATQGFTCFRIDLQGLGESAVPGSGTENHPYPETAVGDTESALAFLKKQLGARRFILVGLCSGAHTAFHAGIELKDYEIVDTVLINPLTYHWKEGLSLDTSAHRNDVANYKRSVKDVKRWMKLLRGQVQVHHALRVMFTEVKRSLFRSSDPTASSPLSKDLLRLFEQGRPLTLFIAEGDPGYGILMAQAKHVSRKAIKAGKLRVYFISNADHTFSTRSPRTDFMSRFSEHRGRFS